MKSSSPTKPRARASSTTTREARRWSPFATLGPTLIHYLQTSARTGAKGSWQFGVSGAPREETTMKKLSIGSWAYCFGPYKDNPVDFHTVVHKLSDLGLDGVELGGFPPHPSPDSHDTIA